VKLPKLGNSAACVIDCYGSDSAITKHNRAGRSSSDSENMAPSLGSLALLDDVAGGPTGKQRPDQLHGRGLVALRTLIALQAIG